MISEYDNGVYKQNLLHAQGEFNPPHEFGMGTGKLKGKTESKTQKSTGQSNNLVKTLMKVSASLTVGVVMVAASLQTTFACYAQSITSTAASVVVQVNNITEETPQTITVQLLNTKTGGVQRTNTVQRTTSEEGSTSERYSFSYGGLTPKTSYRVIVSGAQVAADGTGATQVLTEFNFTTPTVKKEEEPPAPNSNAQPQVSQSVATIQSSSSSMEEESDTSLQSSSSSSSSSSMAAVSSSSAPSSVSQSEAPPASSSSTASSSSPSSSSTPSTALQPDGTSELNIPTQTATVNITNTDSAESITVDTAGITVTENGATRTVPVTMGTATVAGNGTGSLDLDYSSLPVGDHTLTVNIPYTVDGTTQSGTLPVETTVHTYVQRPATPMVSAAYNVYSTCFDTTFSGTVQVDGTAFTAGNVVTLQVSENTVTHTMGSPNYAGDSVTLSGNDLTYELTSSVAGENGPLTADVTLSIEVTTDAGKQTIPFVFNNVPISNG